jgi:hypothetical protein
MYIVKVDIAEEDVGSSHVMDKIAHKRKFLKRM